MKAIRNYIYCFFLSSLPANPSAAKRAGLWRAGVLCLLLFISVLHADTLSKPTWRSFSEAGRFITAIAWDKDNHLWVAGEEFGVSMIPARFDAKQAGGDSTSIQTFDILYCYTIVCDDLGRVWIGSLRQGLYCYEKGKWKNFNTSNGLPSNSVYALALDKNNTLYCAAGLGLAKLSAGKWTILSLPDTLLPKSEISCMDFDIDGNLWVGFFLGGVAKFNGLDWELYPIINKSSIELLNEVSNLPGVILNLTTFVICKGVYTEADGLINERVNDILAAKDGTIWVTTCKGISSFQPKTGSPTPAGRRTGGHWRFFTYVCDTLWADSPVNYFLKFTQDKSGNIFFVNRHETIQRWDNKDFCVMGSAPKKQLPDTFVYCITTDDDGYLWAGAYGEGIITNNPTFKFPKEISQSQFFTFPDVSLIDSSKVPEQKQLISKTYKSLKNALRGEQACYIGEDWLTRGDWFGKYGEYAWILCSYYHYGSEPEGWVLDLIGGSDMLNPYSFKHVRYFPYIGENADPDDMLRGWLQWASTDNPKVLQDPLRGGRRHTEWDDHAEWYPHAFIREGPHIYLDLDIPEGAFIVSFYFMNKDGQERPWERFRDYTISVKKRTTSEKEFEDSPVLASCRVHDFRAGVYKRFMLKGPGRYTIKFDKKESFNTIMSAVFIDKVEE